MCGTLERGDLQHGATRDEGRLSLRNGDFSQVIKSAGRRQLLSMTDLICEGCMHIKCIHGAYILEHHLLYLFILCYRLVLYTFSV